MGYLVVAPDAAGTVQSFSALRYSLESGRRGPVDNSVDAGAQLVDVEFHWAGAESYVAAIDDGRGMTPEELRDAMTLAFRGTHVQRTATELGRFGMGLKTASFSQATKLIVGTGPPTATAGAQTVVSGATAGHS